MQFRGANFEEIKKAISFANWTPAEGSRMECRMDFPFVDTWNGKIYRIKQIRPIFVESTDEIIVITVYTYYFD
jgi:hypothetical protein